MSATTSEAAEGGGQKPTAPQEWKPRYNPWLVAVIVTLAAFMEILDTTIVNVALPHIAGSLSASNDEATWTLTTYLVANGIVLTISGYLSRVLGRKRYFMICIAAFGVCSLLCGLSTELWQLILFRLLQGLFGGGLQPTQQGVILDSFPPEKRGSAFSLTAIAIIVAPILGPTVGGWITDNFSWHWIFLINVPVSIITFFGVAMVVEDPPWVKEETKKRSSLDYIGLGFIVMALGGMELALDRGQDLDWLSSNFIRITAILSICGFVFGSYWLIYAKKPIVDIRVLKDRNFALSSALIFMMATVLYSSAVLLPQLSQTQLGYTSTLAGMVMMPGAIVLAMLIPISGKLMTFIAPKYLICVGALCLGSALLYSHNLTPTLDFHTLMLMRGAQTIGLAFLFVPISTTAYATIPRHLQGDATALFTMFRNVAGSVGISTSTALITQQSQVHMAHLSGYASDTWQPYNELLARTRQGLIDLGTATGDVAQTALAHVYQQFTNQAALLAYMDVFLISAVLAFCMVPLALGLKGRGRGGPPAGTGH